MLKGVKKAVGDYNHWQGHAEILLDLETERIWTICYTSDNEWIDFKDEPVFILFVKVGICNRDHTMTMKDVNALAEKLLSFKGKDTTHEELMEHALAQW